VVTIPALDVIVPAVCSEQVPDGWTLDGYGAAVLEAGITVRLFAGHAAIPEWAGAVAHALSAWPHREQVRALRYLANRGDRDVFAAVARLGDGSAVAAALAAEGVDIHG